MFRLLPLTARKGDDCRKFTNLDLDPLTLIVTGCDTSYLFPDFGIGLIEFSSNREVLAASANGYFAEQNANYNSRIVKKEIGLSLDRR